MSILALRFRGLRNAVFRHPGRYVAALCFVALADWGLFAATRWGVRFLDGFPAIGTIADAVARRSIEGLFTILVAGVAFSVLTTAIATLFRSQDLVLLLSLPVAPWRVFQMKTFETFVTSAALPAVFTLPVLLALGIERSAPFVFYPVSLVAVLSLYALPVALGAGLALMLVRIAPAGRVEEAASAASVLLAAGLVLGLRALRPEQLSALDGEEFERLLRDFASFEIAWFPPTWTSDAVFAALAGRVDVAAVLLPILAVSLLAGVGWLAARAYQAGWIRTSEGTATRRDTRRLRAAWWERPLTKMGRTGAVVVKDARLLMRDPSQWSQLLVLAALAGVYLVSTASIAVDLQRFRDAMGAINLVFVGFLLAGVGVRIAFPAVSLEGEGFWLLRTAPLDARQVVVGKFLGALPVMAVLGLGLGFAASRLIDVSPALAVASPIAGGCSAVAITALGVGLGAAFPRFDTSNPAEVPMSPGGLLYMVLSFAYAVLMTVILAYPVFRTIQGAWRWESGEGLLVLALLVGVTVVSAVLALGYGSYHLARWEASEA